MASVVQAAGTGDGIAAGSKVTFPDGLQVSIVQTSQAVVNGEGVGVLQGEKFTRITLEVVNGSAVPVDATRTVVALTYGSPARQARVVYEPQSRDLASVLPAGGKASAAYSFSVPSTGMAGATLSIDIDGGHGLAVFHGRVG